jgi:hypothetical protein
LVNLAPDDEDVVLQGMRQALDGRTVTGLLRDSDAARQLEEKRHHPAKALTPDEEVEQELAEARESVGDVAASIKLALETLAHTKVSPAERERALDVAVQWTGALRECQKAKRKGMK